MKLSFKPLYSEKNETLDAKYVCLSKDCIAASHRIFEYMDDKVDPCEDFNMFACGGFKKNTIIPDELGSWMPYHILYENVENSGRKLMEQEYEDEFESYKKAKTFYKSCINEKKRNELGIKPLKEILAKAGGWPVVEGDSWNGKDYDIWKQSILLKQMGLGSGYNGSNDAVADKHTVVTI